MNWLSTDAVTKVGLSKAAFIITPNSEAADFVNTSLQRLCAGLRAVTFRSSCMAKKKIAIAGAFFLKRRAQCGSSFEQAATNPLLISR